MAESVLRVAAKAIITNSEGRVLILREAAYADGTNTGKYSLPGGRMEPGEAFMDALKREIQEETGLQDVTVGEAVHVDEWRPVINGTEQQIVGVFVSCTYKGGDVQVSNEHDEAVWLNPDERDKYPLMAAELAAIDAFVRLRDR